MSTTYRVILAGGSGFLGALLAEHFAKQQKEVVILTRTPQAGNRFAREVGWDGVTRGAWTRELDGALALINLAGRSVNCRYHARNRNAILTSRVNSTRLLGDAIARSSVPPRVWLNSSTATIYKHSLDRPMDEATGEFGASAEAKDVFSVAVANAWERALAESEVPHTRKVALRTAMVFGRREGTVFHVLRRLVRCGLGGRMGDGHQYVSWIHQEDFCRGIDWLLQHESLSGPVNLAAPHPVTNAELMRTLREICEVPIGLPSTRWMLEAGAFLLRTETELVIKSRRVIPARLMASGFEFRFPLVREALEDLTIHSSA